MIVLLTYIHNIFKVLFNCLQYEGEISGRDSIDCVTPTDLEIPLNESSDGEESSSSEGGQAGAGGSAGAAGGGGRLPALRLVLSAAGASVALERPNWTLYRAVLALNARLPLADTHRDLTYT